ncbi:MAG: class I SAM-dependent rRNA methyltransferase [Armatimonadota bacterium]|nr:class I SAM-dependent rRNA methyltransferase [Armatimonadota bacterium]MDR7518138.1 class I SAM-dependent rRNA methyltransferase [Armatimonadota bacterium]MDR7550283.1 class I SAM-dependent rRNA methyltransferase [Armatimonadota bacterium]
MGAQDRVTGRVRLRRGREGRVAEGHLWVYDGEIGAVDGHPAPGSIVDVCTSRGRFLGRGYFNPHSKIRVRLLTDRDEPIDEAFLARRLQAAIALRQRVVNGTTAYRLIFGEGDLLPGLIVDRYGDLLVMQTLTAGMDVRKDQIADLLVSLTGVGAVYLRNDAKSRAQEALPLYQGFARGQAPTQVEIREGPARFLVDVAGGQKTGWFCDQRENRLAAAALAPGAAVLDAFCYTGAFGIQAALAGAVSVVGLEVSEDAVASAQANAERNGVAGRCAYRRANAFDELRRLQQEGARYDLVILDPPAFARSRATVPQALAGYKEINLRAMSLLRPEGFLVSCSCSWHVDERMFWTAVLDAARDVRRGLRLIEFRSQARDHPMLAAMPETRYLKCLILQVF